MNTIWLVISLALAANSLLPRPFDLNTLNWFKFIPSIDHWPLTIDHWPLTIDHWPSDQVTNDNWMTTDHYEWYKTTTNCWGDNTQDVLPIDIDSNPFWAYSWLTWIDLWHCIGSPSNRNIAQTIYRWWECSHTDQLCLQQWIGAVQWTRSITTTRPHNWNWPWPPIRKS